MISNRTRILVTLDSTDFGYCILRTHSFANGRSQAFYVSRQPFGDWLSQAPWTAPSYIENDCCSFLKVRNPEDGQLRFTVFWLSSDGYDGMRGRRETFRLPYDAVVQAVRHGQDLRLSAAVESGESRANISLSGNAHRQIRRLSGRKLKKRAFTKAMRDCFHWQDSRIELYSDFGDDFCFREKRGESIGIVGGLCLSRSEVRGRDGQTYPRYAYSVHT